jgi:hypothetical protein
MGLMDLSIPRGGGLPNGLRGVTLIEAFLQTSPAIGTDAVSLLAFAGGV